MPLPQIQTKIPDSGDMCEFFHKKRVDRFWVLLYYRASVILERENCGQIQGEMNPPTHTPPGFHSIAIASQYVYWHFTSNYERILLL